MSNAKAAELVSRCFHARTAAHIFHLATRSFAEHKALNEFYDEIVPVTDTFAETYQGTYGLLGICDCVYKQGDTPKAMLASLDNWIADNRYEAVPKSDTALQNIVDEIVGLISQTQYKLRFLS